VTCDPDTTQERTVTLMQMSTRSRARQRQCAASINECGRKGTAGCRAAVTRGRQFPLARRSLERMLCQGIDGPGAHFAAMRMSREP